MKYLWIALLLLPQVVQGEEIDTSKWTFPTESYYGHVKQGRECVISVTQEDIDSMTYLDSAIISEWATNPCKNGWQYNKQTRDCEKISGHCPVCGEKGVGTGVRIYHKGLTFACPKCHLLFWD